MSSRSGSERERGRAVESTQPTGRGGVAPELPATGSEWLDVPVLPPPLRVAQTRARCRWPACPDTFSLLLMCLCPGSRALDARHAAGAPGGT